MELVAYRGEEGADACPMCANLYLFGERILKEDVFCISRQMHGDALPLPGLDRELYLSAESLASIESLPYETERLYIKNKVYTGERLATHLWLGDHTARRDGRIMEFADLAAVSGGAQESAGIRRLGVLRADVDSLGAAFRAGFPGKYATLTRTAVLSRQLSLFFKHYINALCRGEVNGVNERDIKKFSLFGTEKKAEMMSSCSAHGTMSSSLLSICAVRSSALRAGGFIFRRGLASSRRSAPWRRWRVRRECWNHWRRIAQRRMRWRFLARRRRSAA